MLRSLTALPRTAVRSFSATSCSFSETRTKPPSDKDVDALFADKSEQTARKHAYSRNRVEIVGGVATEPVLRTAKNNNPFVILHVITNHTVKLAGGEHREMSEFHPVSIFGPLAHQIVKTVKKGDRVLVEGRLHHTGGQLNEQGERAPRQIHILGMSVQPFAKTQQD